jgi:Yip1 domain
MAIFEVFYEPGKVFSSLENRKGAWVAPLLLGVLFLVLTTYAAVHYIGMETILRQQLENTRLSPEQMQVAMNRANSPNQVYVTYAGAVVAGCLSVALIAALLTVFALMGSKEPKFSTNFSMVALALFPYRLVVCAMTVLVLIAAPDRTVLDVSNLLATNVGAFLNKEGMSRGLYTLLSALDVLTFAEIGLMGYGFAKANRTGISFGLFSVLSLWAIYVLIRMGLSLLF